MLAHEVTVSSNLGDRNVDIVYFDAGSGHRSAALALQAVLHQHQPGWRVRTVNLLDLLATHRIFQRTTRLGIAYFNWMLRRERIFDLRGLIRLSLLCHDLVTVAGQRAIARFWADAPPDVIVSVTPMNNEVLARSARLAQPRATYITIPVDFEEVMPRYWFTPKQDIHYLVGSDRLAAQAERVGIPAARVERLSGFPIHPGFYTEPPANVVAELARLGLNPNLPTALVSFGGQGSILVRDVARRLVETGLRLNLILLCGRDERLRADLEAWHTPVPKLVLGYTPESPVIYHQLATFVVGKPGTMTITESLVAGRPLIAPEADGMAPVQRGNQAWLQASGVGLVAPGLAGLEPAVREVLAHREQFHQRIARLRSRGVFEAAESIVTLARQNELIAARRGQASQEEDPHRGA
jgi:UDP-N-acetylglucosamine:LPS N-acetylglucosamine transferase